MCGFCSKFYSFSACKNFENRLRFDKVAESLKMGTFLRHSVVLISSICDVCCIFKILYLKRFVIGRQTFKFILFFNETFLMKFDIQNTTL